MIITHHKVIVIIGSYPAITAWLAQLYARPEIR